MAGFNYEKNLDHQTDAVNSTISVFSNLEIIKPVGADSHCINPLLEYKRSFNYIDNLISIQNLNGIEEKRNGKSNIIDIMMETGTGKTYTYTKTIFELNKNYGIFKFIIVVPTLSIKAGTIDFLRSVSSREHFKEQYGKSIQLHIVESRKNSKSKKSYQPQSVKSFVNAGDFERNKIQVMIINAGMINSDTMKKQYDQTFFDKYDVPFEGISAVKPFLIIDEPHKFPPQNTTWNNLKKMNPQFVLRYGATFKEYSNLVYTLSAVDSFNRNLVKGVIGHITEFDVGKDAIVRLLSTDGKEASFQLVENRKQISVKLAKKESLQKVHPEMSDLTIESMNKTTVRLSNGMEIKRGDKINPYSYAQTLQELMIKKAIHQHFKLERSLLNRDVKIKPLTLFFIDNIEEYRNQEGSVSKILEESIIAEIKELLKTEEKGFYTTYLEKTLSDVSKSHAGYFSRDNSEKDEAIEQEVNEILHDKQEMLKLENPRRFIFSKWTLREGWDNPNVFQICKLRSSGSDISKLQEIGRGLRLPVNEYGNRVKDEQFYLNYFVDFTENDFVDSLVKEINEKSGAISIENVPEKLNCEIIKKIIEIYKIDEEELLEKLDKAGMISRTNKFKSGGFDYIKQHYPLIFTGVGSNKVRKATENKKKITLRTEKYQELKLLWEKLNEKVILEYQFEDETIFLSLLISFFQTQKIKFSTAGLRNRKSKVAIEDGQAVVTEVISVLENEVTPISIMKYSDFLKNLSSALNINMKTIHLALLESGIKINQYLNASTIRIIKQNFDNFLMFTAFDKFSIDYQKVSNSIHPTKITDSTGKVLKEVSASDIGILSSDSKVANSYFFEDLYYDSELEKNNIETEIDEIVVFTKIPKNSIKIPVAGGKSYSPDFAYVINFKNGKKKLHFIVETKNVIGEDNLRNEEKQKIKHAEKFFAGFLEIKFKTQFSNNKIVDLINEITS